MTPEPAQPAEGWLNDPASLESGEPAQPAYGYIPAEDGNVVLEARVRFRSEFPAPYNTAEHIRFRYNEGTWSALNIADMLTEARDPNAHVTVEIISIDGKSAQPAESPEARERASYARLLVAQMLHGDAKAITRAKVDDDDRVFVAVDDVEALIERLFAASTARPTERGAVEALRADIAKLHGLDGSTTCDECGAPLFDSDETDTDEAEVVALCAGHVRQGEPIYSYRVPATDQAAEIERLREALEPVMHWYQSDEHETRPLSDIVTDIVADLQEDRGAALKLAALASQPATGRTIGGEEVDALVKALVESESEATVRDMAGHVGDQVHETLKRSGMLMKTTGGTIAVGVMAAAQVLNDTYEFARRSLDDEGEAKEMAAAMRVLFGQNLAPALQNGGE